MITPDNLTNREWDVLALVAEGKKNSQIARQLCITENTVEQHLKKVYSKLRVDNRVAASQWYWLNNPLLTAKQENCILL